jgi:hypothetical protein
MQTSAVCDYKVPTQFANRVETMAVGVLTGVVLESKADS